MTKPIRRAVGNDGLETTVLLERSATSLPDLMNSNKEVGRGVPAVPELEEPRSSKTAKRNRFRCPHCKASYGAIGFLTQHVRLHAKMTQSGSEKPRAEGSRGRHAESTDIVGSEDNFSCKQCGKSFTQKINLEYHMRIHEGQRPYVCRECNADFSQVINLTNHMRVHTGERPYPCKICKSKFKQKSALDNHMRLHTGEKPYLCDHCGRTFAQKSNLDSHMLRHGIQDPPSSKECKVQSKDTHPFACGKCAKKFRREAALLKHRKVHLLL